MGIAAATVVVSILIAVTLTPALLSAVGRLVKPKAVMPTPDDRESPSPKRFQVAQKWIGLVTNVPTLTVVASLAVLGVLATPAFQMRLNFPDNSMVAPTPPSSKRAASSTANSAPAPTVRS